jgi:hypothetical protein
MRLFNKKEGCEWRTTQSLSKEGKALSKGAVLRFLLGVRLHADKCN